MLFDAQTTTDKLTAVSLLEEFLTQIWPIATYASIRFSGRNIQRLSLEEVFERALDAICDKFGFEFATISLVDKERQEICCKAGRNVPEGWIADAHHPLNPPDDEPLDIQAKILRDGKTEICGPGWHENFDRRMYEQHGHHDLIRAFLPLGDCGTVEAGVRETEGGALHRFQVAVLERYCQLNLAPAIENALLHERMKATVAELDELASGLNRLHGVIHEWQTDPQYYEDTNRLERIVEAAHKSLGADFCLAYPLLARPEGDQAEFCFAPPICFPYSALGACAPPTVPTNPENIIYRIANSGSYFASDTVGDVQLQDSAEGRGFVFPRRVHSFAGVPLIARGELLGVLCLNYCKSHSFGSSEKRVIALFAQQAAALLVSYDSMQQSRQLARDYERRQFRRLLHDAVETNVSAIHKFLGLSFESLHISRLEDDPSIAYALNCISNAKHTAKTVLFGIDIIKGGDPSLGKEEGPLLFRDLLLSLLRGLDNSDAAIGREEVKVSFDFEEMLPELQLSLCLAVVWIINQGVCNALEHAPLATRIHSSVRYSSGDLQIEITDDGDGFDHTIERGPEHQGLSNIAGYVSDHKGRFEILSIPDGVQGTTISVTIPGAVIAAK